MNMFKRIAPIFAARRDDALVALRRAKVVACDETGMRIEGCNGYQWLFCEPDVVVHTAVFSRAAQVVRDTMAGHHPTSGYRIAVLASRSMGCTTRPA